MPVSAVGAPSVAVPLAAVALSVVAPLVAVVLSVAAPVEEAAAVVDYG
jgi:hypothetical protein